MGFVAGWITGWAAYSEIVRAAFCAPGERIAGFFFLGSPRLLPGGAPPGAKWPSYDATWAFQLEPVGPEATELTVRVRGAYEPSVRNGILRMAVGTAHEIMQAAQLRNLKWRAEMRPG